MTDKELIKWLETQQDWILYKCLYFTRNMEDAKELKAGSQEAIWKYRNNFNGEVTDDRIKSWAFFSIKYAYFHMLQDKYRKPIYHFEHYNHPELITEDTILRSLEAQNRIDSIEYKLLANLPKKHVKTLILRSKGYTNKEIGEKLDLHPNYVSKMNKQTRQYLDDGITPSERISKERPSRAKKKSEIIAYKMDSDYNITEEHPYKDIQKVLVALNLKKSNVYRALKDEDLTAGGWHFKYKQEI